MQRNIAVMANMYFTVRRMWFPWTGQNNLADV